MWILPLGVCSHLFPFNVTVSRLSSERVASNRMTVIEYSLRKKKRGSIISLNYPGETEEHHETPFSKQSISWPRFEPGPSKCKASVR
jgi:hypothetical protein